MRSLTVAVAPCAQRSAGSPEVDQTSRVTPEQALLAATAVHAGFQFVVTIVVYPALADVPAERWALAHAAHSRRISYIVGPLYVAVAGACLWILLAGPHTVLLIIAVAGNALAALATALRAAPLHGRLGRDGKDPALVTALLQADRVRLFAVTIALAAALLA